MEITQARNGSTHSSGGQVVTLKISPGAQGYIAEIN